MNYKPEVCDQQEEGKGVDREVVDGSMMAGARETFSWSVFA
jgi:hypothetical protein